MSYNPAGTSAAYPDTEESPDSHIASYTQPDQIQLRIHLPDSLVTQILSHLLPPSPPFDLPIEILSKPFKQRLLYLPPGPDEMDKQLSPFPLPISTQALMERLERLSVEHRMEKTEYAWDGESVLGRKKLRLGDEYGGRSGSDGDQNQDGLDLQFQYDEELEEGWGFHGVRVPVSQDDGLQWMSDPESAFSSALSTTTDDADQHEATGNALITLDEHHGSGANAAEVADYWSGFDSQPAHPTHYDQHDRRRRSDGSDKSYTDPYDTPYDHAYGMVSEGREMDLENDYWAQYSAAPSPGPVSAGPSRPVSRGPSRRSSGLVPLSTQANVGAGDPGSPSISTRSKQNQGDRITSSNISALSPLLSPPLASPSSSHRLPTSAAPPQSHSMSIPPRVDASAPAVADNGIKILQNRMIMKITSLLRRAWLEYISTAETEDELEERAMNWLRLGRSLGSKHVVGGNGSTTGIAAYGAATGGGESEAKARLQLELLEEMYSVVDAAEEDGFYRLVEKAVRSQRGQDGGALERRYSTEQQVYWE